MSCIRFLCLTAALLAAPGVGASADRAQEARAFIDVTVGEFLGILGDESLTTADRLVKIEDLAIQRFDLDRMSKLVLGRNRKQLDATQQSEFRDEFKQHINITGHSRGAAVTVGGKRTDQDPTDRDPVQ